LQLSWLEKGELIVLAFSLSHQSLVAAEARQQLSSRRWRDDVMG
jgi:hypothetical protein